MTREERIQERDGIRAECDALILKLNAMEMSLYRKEPVDIPEMNKTANDLKEKVADYDASAKALCYEECVAAGDPMLEAVRVRTYASLTVKDREDDGCPIEHYLDTKHKEIDLLDLNKRVENGIGKSNDWPHVAQKLNHLLTVERAKGLGVTNDQLTLIRDNYTMSAIAKDFDMGKNPVSNTNMLKTLRLLVEKMLGEEYVSKVLSHDVVYLKSVYAKKGKKALSVQCADHKRFVGYMADVCHHIVTGNPYEIESKEIKKK